MIYIIMFIAGCCLGSFINVMLSRDDWYKGRSRCDSCGHILFWYELIPIVSWMIQSGRCRECKEKIGVEHLASELFMGCTFLCGLYLFKHNNIIFSIPCIIALFFIAIAAIEDYKEQMVYSWILNTGIIAVCVAKVIIYIMLANLKNVVILIITVLFFKGVAVILSKWLKDRIGAGDLDILIVMYISYGMYGTVLAFVIACILGCFIYLPQFVMKKRNKSQPLPLVPLLLAGVIYNLLLL